MKIQLLNDLQAEIERLFVAGSRFAKGDPRITKYIPVLNKMGEKAPVMKKLAEKIEVLANAEQQESMDALSEAGAFLYAVLATGGSTEAEGCEVSYEGKLNQFPDTKIPYSQLKPLIEALTMTRSGRLEVIETAFQSGLIQDFRIYAHLVAALADKYAEIPEFLEKRVFPSIGPSIIPYLLEGYDKTQGKSQTRKLSILYELGYGKIEAMAREAIESADANHAAEGVRILGVSRANEEYLLVLTEDRKAQIREAALRALIHMDSECGKEKMLLYLKSAKPAAAILAAKECTDPLYTAKILRVVQNVYDAMLAKQPEDKDFGKAQDDFYEILAVLDNKNDPAVFAFFRAMFQKDGYLVNKKFQKPTSYVRQNVSREIGRFLYKLDTAESLEALAVIATEETLKKHDVLMGYYFNLAFKHYSSSKLYDVFSGFYLKKLLDASQMFGWHNDRSRAAAVKARMDTRWEELFQKEEDAYALLMGMEREDIKTPAGADKMQQIAKMIQCGRRAKDQSSRTARYFFLALLEDDEKIEEYRKYFNSK